VEVLAGGGPADVVELTLALAREMLAGAGRGDIDPVDALADGRAMDVWRRMIRAQGGDPDAPLPQAPVVQAVPAPRGGVVRTCHALRLGEVAMRLGAGRARKEDAVDHAVGIVVDAKAGEEVAPGAPLATVHARSPADVDAAAVAACFEIGDGPYEPPPVVIEVRG
jgi:thymidine phosphorylase